jgi:hypothetical protein
MQIDYLVSPGEMNVVSRLLTLPYKTQKAANLRGFFDQVVELQGIEPWSREDERVRSTCLVDFDCRKPPGRQQPNDSLVTVVSAPLRNHSEAQFMHSTPRFRHR